MTETGLEVMTDSAQKLEQIVAAFRSSSPLPGYESLLTVLKQQCESCAVVRPAPPQAAGSNVVDQSLSIGIQEAKAHGLILWNYTFLPSRELDAQGINLNLIRE